MELRAGYKQTEVGVIPEDWSAAQIGNLARFASGKGISVASLQTQSEDFPVPVFGGNGVAGYTKFPTVHAPCVVVGRVGQRCGAVYLSEGPAWITDNALYPKDLHRPIDQRFFALALKASKLNEVKNKNDLPLITQTILACVAIPWPPIPEQRAIATALSDVDVLLAKIDQLIAKKRDLKQAAMQQLLTGQTRLPGFSGEWEVKPMKSLGQTYGGLAGKTKEDFGHGASKYIPFMNVMTDTVIDPNWLETVDIAQNEAQNLARKGDLFFNGSSETPEEVGFCSVLIEDIPNLYLNSFCFGFRFNTDAKVSGLFFA
jgi:type I restriction enzyme, S subunit